MTDIETPGRTAWQTLLDELFKRFGDEPLPNIELDEPLLTVQLPDCLIEKYALYQDLWLCKATLPQGHLWWWQYGDNTKEVLYIHGADPDEVAALPEGDFKLTEPVEIITIFRSTQARHWFYLTFGLSNLHGSHADDSNTSGYGTELSMRLPCEDGEYEPPVWPVNIFNVWAELISTNGKRPNSGAIADYGRSILPETATAMQGFCVSFDEEFDPLSTVSGKLEIMQLSPLTRDELDFANKNHEASALTRVLYVKDPLKIAHLDRESILADSRKELVDEILNLASIRYKRGALRDVRLGILSAIELIEEVGGEAYGAAIMYAGKAILDDEGANALEEFFHGSIMRMREISPASEHLAYLHLEAGKYALIYNRDPQTSLALFGACYEHLISTQSSSFALVSETCAWLGNSYAAGGNFAEAAKLYRHVLDQYAMVKHDNPSDWATIAEELIGTLEAQGKLDEAVAVREQYKQYLPNS